MISIIIPVYNCVNYIERCINSILGQSIQDFEVILINDGSIDGSKELCDDLSILDSRIKVYHQRNCGVSTTRNKGISLAKGEYISFVDADDYLESDFLEVLLEGFVLGADISYCLAIHEDEKQNIICIDEDSFGKIIDVKEYEWNGPQQHPMVWGALYKKEIIEGVYFDSRFYVGEDSLFWAKCLKKSSKIYYSPETKYHYVHYEESACHGHFSDKKITELYAWKEILELWKTSPVALAYGKRIIEKCKIFYDDNEFRNKYFDQEIKEFRLVFARCLQEIIKKRKLKLAGSYLLFCLVPHLYMNIYKCYKNRH